MSGAASPPAPARPRPHPLLLGSLALSAISVALPAAFGPLGPLAAGVLAFVGHRRARAAPSEYRGPGLALVAMTAALALFAFEAWAMVRTAATARAWAGIRIQLSRVDETLRHGTAEGAFELLSPDARKDLDRVAWVADLRAAMARLGPLVRLGEPREAGGDWARTASFEDGDAADLRLPMVIEADFRDGRGRIELEVLVRRRGGAVASDLTALRLAPAGP